MGCAGSWPGPGPFYAPLLECGLHAGPRVLDGVSPHWSFKAFSFYEWLTWMISEDRTRYLAIHVGDGRELRWGGPRRVPTRR